ncbi:CDF family Co(II)/Ni(II) efflux transporter DmeF [Sphingomonas rosea]|uniref:CDF family Co(II)/Ni(II) efflux transporter DmeF n=1 Tax=Sphingomonas rosea TaxID=335605 RepID=A0ABP7TQB3_9SPHN
MPSSHDHDFLGASHDRNARRTRIVLGLTAITTVTEIVFGTITGSMALVADGWHMATDSLSLAITAFAYSYAKKRAADPRFSWGTGKVGTLAAYSSALVLLAVGIGILVESVSRLLNPVTVEYREALIVAAVGLAINLACAAILGHGGHDHAHGGDHDHDHGHPHDDLNLRSAYLHVLADAVTSLTAIVALAAAWQFGIRWLDAAVGILGAVIIVRWSVILVGQTSRILLDHVPDEQLSAEMRAKLEEGGTIAVVDWHLWTIGPNRYAVIVSATGTTPSEVRRRLGADPRLAHVTVECS